jgi:hypothetical protein
MHPVKIKQTVAPYMGIYPYLSPVCFPYINIGVLFVGFPHQEQSSM